MRQSPASVVGASRRLKEHQAEDWTKGLGCEDEGGYKVKGVFPSCESVENEI